MWPPVEPVDSRSSQAVSAVTEGEGAQVAIPWNRGDFRFGDDACVAGSAGMDSTLAAPVKPGPIPRWRQYRPRQRGGALLHRDDVDCADVRGTGEQAGSNLAECSRDLAVQVGLPVLVGLEAVEDAIAGVTDLERVPGHGAQLGHRELAASLQERGQFRALARHGL